MEKLINKPLLHDFTNIPKIFINVKAHNIKNSIDVSEHCSFSEKLVLLCLYKIHVGHEQENEQNNKYYQEPPEHSAISSSANPRGGNSGHNGMLYS